MPDTPSPKIASQLASLDKELETLAAAAEAVSPALGRLRSDLAALVFHFNRRDDHPPLVVLLGGTGTGKSTVVNRLLESNISASSFRRTFTSGAVAVARDPQRQIPVNWLGVPRTSASSDELPVRGQAGSLITVPLDRPLTQTISLIDTPDLDGDQPAHHAEADRAFRWAEAVIFLVTPEKYQMTELLPYYRMARRYALPALFVMNKCEEPAVLEDFRQQLAGREWPDASIFAVPRDDAAYEPPPEMNLAALRSAALRMTQALQRPERPDLVREALRTRARDLLGRLRDQVLAPLRRQRAEIDRLIGQLRSLSTPAPGLDVSPVASQLQRKLQEQSILYLMGPQRILDRVRQVPTLLARLPRTTWDLFRGQSPGLDGPSSSASASNSATPDFPSLLSDQFTILHSRIDDLVQSSPLLAQDRGLSLQPLPKIPPSGAARIAEEELGVLKQWLDQRWQATPRDTATLHRLLKLIPGAKTVGKYSEAAPYLLAVIVAAHGAVFGPIDLIILGSFSLATWVGEKVSNEVTARTRSTNRQISDRFLSLAKEQIEQVCAFLNQQAPTSAELSRLERAADDLAELL